jgi:hypothetical protein
MGRMVVGGTWQRTLAKARTGSFDWVVAGVVGAAVYALHGFHGGLTRDPAIFVYGAARVADGLPPYVANFNTVGPLADAVPGAAVALGRILGVGPVLSSRLLFWIISAGCCSLVYVLGRQLTGRRLGGYVGAALFLTFEMFSNMATNGPREKTFMVLCLLAGFILAASRSWMAAGAATGLATLTWQPALLPMVAGIGVMMLGAPSRWRGVGRYLAGGAVTVVAAFAWFAAYGAVDVAVKAFLVTNVRWVHQPSAFEQPTASLQLLWSGYHASLIVVVVGVVALVVLAVVRRRDLLLVGTAVGALVSVVWTAKAFNGTPDLFVVLPFGAVGAALAVILLDRWAGRYGTVAATAVALVAVGSATVWSVSTRAEGLIVDVRNVRAVLGSVPPTARIATIDGPQPLIFSGRINPEPYLILDDGELGLLEHEWPGGVPGYLHDLLAGTPTLLAIGPGPDMAAIRQVTDPLYAFAGHGAGVDWYVARREGDRLLREVRRANATSLEAALSDARPGG